MDDQDIRRRVKLGGFVLGGLLIFFCALVYLGRESNLFNKTFVISAIFKNVEGLKEGDKVWLSGVKIGVVKNVEIISEGEVVVVLSLKDMRNQFIKSDATAFVGSDGLVGNKIVVIRPGIAKQVVHDYDTINALSPTDTQELFNIAKEVGVNARSISDDLKLISSRLNRGEGVFGELLHDGPIAKNLRNAIISLEYTGQNAHEITEKAISLLDEVNDGDGLMAKLITDSTYAQMFQQTLSDLSKTSDNSRKMSEDLKAIIAKIDNQDNAIGVLLTDTLFAQKLRSTMNNAQAASLKLDENLNAMRDNFLFRRYFKKKKRAAEQNSTDLARKE